MIRRENRRICKTTCSDSSNYGVIILRNTAHKVNAKLVATSRTALTGQRCGYRTGHSRKQQAFTVQQFIKKVAGF
jgi:hypothetical protein